MRFLKLGIFTFVILYVVSHSIHAKEREVRNLDSYSFTKKWGEENYVISDQFGCKSVVRFFDSDTHFDIMSGGIDCKSSKPKNVEIIISSLKELFRKYHLKNKLFNMAGVSINLSWKVSNWPLTLYANESDKWPKEITPEISDIKNESLRYLFEQTILDVQVYGLFVDFFRANGCILTLNKYFSDPMNYTQMYLTNTELLKMNFFGDELVKKREYPYIQSPIIFDLKCK